MNHKNEPVRCSGPLHALWHMPPPSFRRRAYCIGAEIFLPTAFLATLIASALVGFGVLSFNNEDAEHAATAQPLPAAQFK